MTMVVGALSMTLHLPLSHSLKDKRQVVQSLLSRLRQRFAVAAAEVDDQDVWQIATLGVCCVSNNARRAEQRLQEVQQYIEETRPDVVIQDVKVEVLRV
jgi:uncharacterized protein YlxP (DUF503 family)